MIMKRIVIFSALLMLLGAAASAQGRTQDPVGTVVYSLPQTSLVFDVEVQREDFHAGPYASYAKKYLGIDVRLSDEVICTLAKVVMTPFVEADHANRYVLNVQNPTDAPFLKLSSMGLISFADANYNKDAFWRFPAPGKGDFNDKGVTSNLATESTTLSAYNSVSVQQTMVVEKSEEKRASEAAEMIFSLRKKRVQIITGDTDMTYAGEAMGAAIDEMTRLEKEYMTLFTGYSDKECQNVRFEVVPEAGREMQKYIAFKFSETGGVTAADDPMGGAPVVLELTVEDLASGAVADESAAKPSKGPFLFYRTPAVCKAKLIKGADVILQSRIPVYQLGVQSSIPVSLKIK